MYIIYVLRKHNPACIGAMGDGFRIVTLLAVIYFLPCKPYSDYFANYSLLSIGVLRARVLTRPYNLSAPCLPASRGGGGGGAL